AGDRHRLAKAAIQTLEQLPGPPVAHVQLARRLRQRTARADVLEQRDLAGSHGRIAPEVDAEANGWNAHGFSPTICSNEYNETGPAPPQLRPRTNAMIPTRRRAWRAAALLWLAAALTCPVSADDSSVSAGGGGFDRWFATSDAAKESQPHWMTPV